MKPLNIFDAVGNPVTGWSTTSQLNEDAISQLKDKSAKSANALNSVPSPFSRLHVFDTAFKLVSKDVKDHKEHASEGYKELVSDCLDAIEMLFNANFHKSQGDELSFERWDISQLKDFSSAGEGQKIFNNSLSLFLEKDFGTADYPICIVKYKNMVIAGTSPFTLLFTSPNLDKADGKYKNAHYEGDFDLINPATGHSYFKKTIGFSERGEAFKAYLQGFFEDNPVFKRVSSSLWGYLVEAGINHFTTTIIPKTSPVSCKNGGPFSVNGIPLKVNSADGSTDIFNDHIVKVNYPVNSKNFYTPAYLADEDNRKYDFLLPFKPEFLKTIELSQIPKLINYEIIGKDVIRVNFLGDENTSAKTKTFSRLTGSKQEGKVIDVEEDYRLNLTVGVFPFLKMVDINRKPINSLKGCTYNDYYKVLLGIDINYGSDFLLRTSDFFMEFYRKNGDALEMISSDGGSYNAKRFERRQLETPDSIASIYYELRDTCFDLAEIHLPSLKDYPHIGGVMVPKWKEKQVSGNVFKFSVDFGTTNTFIAYTDDQASTSEPVPFTIGPGEMQMVMLHRNDPPVGGKSVTSTFLQGNAQNIYKSVVIHEFVPPVILSDENDSPYKMPFRTAVFQKNNVKDFKLFDDVNIHFAYQKALLDSSSSMYQDIIPNIKWEITNKHDISTRKRVEAYIRELCYMIKYKVLLNDGDLSKAHINWFIPQSLSYAAITDYKNIWKSAVEDIICNDPDEDFENLKMVFESEAPYYFLKRGAKIVDPKSVVSVDIGGGSTDVMLFVNQLPLIGTSFNFAGNVLWGNGYNQFTSTARENGFYKKMKPRMDEKISKNFDIQQNYVYFSKRSTDEIINFWISNNDKLDVVSELRNPEFKIVYLVHFCATVYHIVQLLKSTTSPAPTCFIFSGNGSKYIDFLGDENLLTIITGFIIDAIYGTSGAKPQVVLPKENRKEATCFGGIFKDNDEKFSSNTYLGTTLDYPNAKTPLNYHQVDAELSDIKKSVTENILNLFGIIKNLSVKLSFKTYFNIDTDISALYNLLQEKLPNYFDNGYNIRKEKIDFQEPVSDSLFFYPLIGVIFELGLLNPSSLNEYGPKDFWYVNQPSGENTFSIKDLDSNQRINNNYKIAAPNSRPNEATYELIEGDNVNHRAYVSFDSIIKPVCDCEPFTIGEGKFAIRMLNAGKLRKDGDEWVVTERLRLEFVSMEQ
jgi:hypothetical protein